MNAHDLVKPFALALGALLLDQITKTIVAVSIPLHGAIEVLPVFNLVHVINWGAAFSFLSDQPGWQRWLFTALGIGISAILAILIVRRPRAPSASAYALIIGGAIGNVLDRLWRGAVVDWLDFHLSSHHWPAFNIADSSIFLGVALLLYTSLFSPPEQQPDKH